jgi:hypothetical protein
MQAERFGEETETGSVRVRELWGRVEEEEAPLRAEEDQEGEAVG